LCLPNKGPVPILQDQPKFLKRESRMPSYLQIFQIRNHDCDKRIEYPLLWWPCLTFQAGPAALCNSPAYVHLEKGKRIPYIDHRVHEYLLSLYPNHRLTCLYLSLPYRWYDGN